MTPLLRITSPEEWAAGLLTDDGDGFVHLSAPHQVVAAANAHYRGRDGLQLLVLDGERLEGDVRLEGGFPHLYGRLSQDAVDDVVELPCDGDGRFRLALVPMYAGDPPASDLVSAMIADLEPLYGRIDSEGTPSASAGEMWRPNGTFLVGWDEGGRPVCGGGVKRLGEGVCEIKRMYVEPGARSRGHARRLLRGLEDAARRLGYSAVRLDTGARQPHALALYSSAGYEPIPDYNGNPFAAYWAEKHL